MSFSTEPRNFGDKKNSFDLLGPMLYFLRWLWSFLNSYVHSFRETSFYSGVYSLSNGHFESSIYSLIVAQHLIYFFFFDLVEHLDDYYVMLKEGSVIYFDFWTSCNFCELSFWEVFISCYVAMFIWFLSACLTVFFF